MEGVIRNFLIDIPIACAVDLGSTRAVQSLRLDQQQVYEYLKTMPLPSGSSAKDKLMMGDLVAHNGISHNFFNSPPACELIYSQINEMDDALDRLPLPGGPIEGGVLQNHTREDGRYRSSEANVSSG